MNHPIQVDLLNAGSVSAAPAAPDEEIPPPTEPGIGLDILFDYHQAGSGLWVVRATHSPSGRSALTTVGAVPVDELVLDKLAKSARRAV